MRIEDGIYFSPNFRFSDLDLDLDYPKNLINAFEDRINFYYLEPARSLNTQFQAFSRGLICISLIDLFSKIETNSKKVGFIYEFLLITHLREFNAQNLDNKDESVAKRFYSEFRNSLVHECCIDNAGQFAHDYNSIVHFIRDSERHIMIINPKLLLISIENYSESFFENIKDDKVQFTKLKNWMLSCFIQDFESANRIRGR